MFDHRDIARKRALLTTVRTQFSPQVQPLKESAIDRIFTNILLFSPGGSYMDEEGVLRAFKTDSGGFSLNLMDTRRSLLRMQRQGDVEADPASQYRKFRLSVSKATVVAAERDQAEKLLDSVVRRLFAADRNG